MNEIEKFTPKRQKIAKLLDEGLEAKEVMKRAKCSHGEVYFVLNSAIFQDWQRSEALAELGGRGAKVAIKTLIDIAQNKKAGSQARVSASDKLLHYTGLKLDAEGNIDKNPSNMTAQELNDRLQQLQKEALNRAKPVNVIEGEIVSNDKNNIDDLL